jgi:hypothetical protein
MASFAQRVVTDNMTTESLTVEHITFDDGSSSRRVRKVLRPASASPHWARIPAEFHQTVLDTLDWRDEPRVYRCGLAEHLPDGLRMPAVYGVEEGGDRITLLLEHVDDVTPWDDARYTRTARVLGRLAGRWDGDAAAKQFGLGWRDIGTMFFGKVLNEDLRVQGDDGFWRQPHIAGLDGIDVYRRDLFRLAEAMPAMIASLGELPTGVAHGDTSTTNFLERGDGTIVAIDWSYAAVSSIGSDLAQLVASRFDCGECPADDVDPQLAFGAFCEGVGDVGRSVSTEDVERAWAVHLAIRSVFAALTVGADELSAGRFALARYGLDLALRVGPRSPASQRPGR